MLRSGYSIAQVPPTPPTLDYVSINYENNEVIVNWIPSPDMDVLGYGVQEEFPIGSSKLIHSVVGREQTYTSFSFPKVLSSPVRINMDAHREIDERGLRTPSHITMLTRLEYDTCNKSIKVKWTPYGGWRDRLINYKVMQYFPGSNTQLLAELDTTKKEYIIQDVTENQNYKIFVMAVRIDGRSSNSNVDSITTTFPLPPTYILGDHTRYSGTNQLNIKFTVDPSSQTNLFRLYRSEATSNNYSAIADLSRSADGTIEYSDVLPSFNVYNYRLHYLNKCRIEGVSSIPINNILLKGRSEASNNNLTWNSFEIWPEGTDEVIVYRSSDQGTLEPIANLSANATEYSDFISAESQMSGDICYQVRAVSNPDILGKINISESNVFCVNMLGEVFVPNAFTPNNDGLNDIFKPSFSILPGKYTFMIFNRYGAKIFETNDISKGWDGRLTDGSKALEGAYIYYIRMENGAGKVLEKRGNFSLIYP